MSSALEFRTGSLHKTLSNGKEMPPAGGFRWSGWAVLLSALCVLGAAGYAHGADPGFDFDDFTKNKPFILNTLPTTPYGPPWADILLAPQNFLACKGAKIALCYYSGPANPIGPDAAPTPCELTPDGAIANCTCFAIPPDENPYYVDINAILNLDVYLDTVEKCGSGGRNCKPTGPHEAPVCHTISNKTLIPGADLISAFSTALEYKYPTPPPLELNCPTPDEPYARYAGCMTAPCKTTIDPATGLPPIDPATGLELVQCACPTYAGTSESPAPYQVGYPGDNSCNLGGKNVWSAAYTVQISPPDCKPDVPGGCPLLPPNQPFPPVPANVSCQQVCSEYRQSNQNGTQIGFTCDATLCTAGPTSPLTTSACRGLLTDRNLSEIFKLETEVGYSCAASQICGCQPNKKTNQEIWRLNEAQKNSNIETQCVYNGTLCGTQP